MIKNKKILIISFLVLLLMGCQSEVDNENFKITAQNLGCQKICNNSNAFYRNMAYSGDKEYCAIRINDKIERCN